jgi:glutamate carboxypeptidase
VDLAGLPGAMRARLPQLLADIEPLVRCESPSADLPAVAASADVVATVGERVLGAAPERIVLAGRRWRPTRSSGPARGAISAAIAAVHQRECRP